MEKDITLNELARMIQGEFVSMHEEFTSVHEEFVFVHERLKEHDDAFVRIREDIKILRNDHEGEFAHIREDIKVLRNDMETGFSGIALILKSIHEDIQDFKKVKIEVAELRNRVERLEAKLGIAG